MITDVKDITSFKWATVYGTNPLSIKLDGDTAPLALVPESLVDPLLLAPGARVRVELSLRKCVVHGVSQGGLRGTTAERDLRFGVPANDTERVALANKAVVWYNTDRKWEESYYATHGLTGLITGRNVSTDIPSGWYPTGRDGVPEISMNPIATFAASTGNYVGNWNGQVRRRGGATAFTYDSQGPRILIPGLYDISVYTVQPAGSGLADYHIRLLDSDGTTVDWQHNLAGIALSSSYFTSISAQFKSQMVLPNAYLKWFCSNGSLALHNTSGPVGSGRGQLHVRYVRPALVGD